MRQEWTLRLGSSSSCWLLLVPTSGTDLSPGAGPAFAISHAVVNGMEHAATPPLDLVPGYVF